MMLLLGSSSCCCCWALIVMLMVIYGRSSFVGGFRSRVGGFRSRVGGADDLEEVNGLACWFCFFFLSFGKRKLYVCLLQLSTQSNVNVIGEGGWLVGWIGCFSLARAQR